MSYFKDEIDKLAAKVRSNDGGRFHMIVYREHAEWFLLMAYASGLIEPVGSTIPHTHPGTPSPPTEPAASVDDMPRRCRHDLHVPAEKAITKAMSAVEAMPASVQLTEAVTLLSRARDKVSDFVDGVSNTPRYGNPLRRGDICYLATNDKHCVLHIFDGVEFVDISTPWGQSLILEQLCVARQNAQRFE